MKTCITCRIELPLSEFHRRKGAVDGLCNSCKACAIARARKHYEKHREEAKARARRHHEEHRHQANERRRQRYRARYEAERAARKSWRASNLERARQIVREWISRNPERKAAVDKAWRKENQARLSEAKQRYRQAHRGRYNAYFKAYVLMREQRVPSWADLAAIRTIYETAQWLRDQGIPVQVDHVVPLKGKRVSGLHVHNNLQLLLALENRTKSNKWLEAE